MRTVSGSGSGIYWIIASHFCQILSWEYKIFGNNFKSRWASRLPRLELEIARILPKGNNIAGEFFFFYPVINNI